MRAPWLLSLHLLACTSPQEAPKPEPGSSGAPRPSGSAASVVSAAPVPPAPPAPPAPEAPPPPIELELVHTLEFTGVVTRLDGGVLVCQGTCEGQSAPDVAVVTGRDKPATGLMPPAFRTFDAPFVRSAEISFEGSYPDGLRASVGFTMSAVDRTNAIAPAPDVPSFELRGGKWEPSKGGRVGAPPGPPLPYDGRLALVEAHIVQGIGGAGGPLLREGKRPEPVSALLDGSWRPLPQLGSSLRSALRLLDGRTLLASGKLWVVDKQGSLSAVEGLRGSPYAAVVLAGEPWILTDDAKKTLFYAPKAGSKLAVPGGKGARAAEAKLGPPKKATADCKTPWVTLSTPPRAGWSYEATRKALAGKASGLQKDVTFVEYVDAGMVRFGAQCKTADACSELAATFEKATRGKTAQGCLDAVAAIPNPDVPPADLRIVVLDLQTGAYYP